MRVKMPGRPENDGYGTRAPITRWVDAEHRMQRDARNPQHPAARIGLELAWRVGLPLVLGTLTDFTIGNHTLEADLIFSGLYAGGINGGERALSALASSQRENARRRGQRNDSFVAEATRHRVTRQNVRDKRIHDDGVTEGAQNAQLGTRASRAFDALRGDHH